MPYLSIIFVGKVDIGGELDEEAAILLGDLEDIGSLGSPSEEGAPVISGATSESNSRLTSPASVEVCMCVWGEGMYLTNFILFSILSILH